MLGPQTSIIYTFFFNVYPNPIFMLMGVHISVFMHENFTKSSQPHIDPNEAREAHEILIQSSFLGGKLPFVYIELI